MLNDFYFEKKYCSSFKQRNQLWSYNYTSLANVMQIMARKEQNDLSDFEWGFNCDIVTKTLERYILF